MFICSGSNRGIELRKVEYNNKIDVSSRILLNPNFKNFVFSKDLQFCLFFNKTTVQTKEFPDKLILINKFNFETGEVQPIYEHSVPNILSVSFSPLGTYFYVICRKNSFTESNNIPLIQIIKTSTGELIRSFNYKSDIIPTIFWSNDEKIFANTFSEGIHFVDTKSDIINEHDFLINNLEAVSFTDTNQGIRFALVHNDSPRRLKIFEYKELKLLSQRPLLAGDSFTVKISPKGFSAVSIGSKKVSENSFYGDSYPFYLNIEKKEKLSVIKSGPVFSIEYNPLGDKFVLISGNVPPAVQVFHDRVGGNAGLGEFHVNSVRYSCNPDIFALGGFGSFTGAIKVINIVTKTVLATGEAPYTSEWEWSPCGRFILTSVLITKLMVGNEFKIFNHLLGIEYTEKFEELIQCQWIGLIKPLPLPKINIEIQEKKKTSVYVPPHLRNNNNNNSNKNFPPGFEPKK